MFGKGKNSLGTRVDQFLVKMGIGMRAKLIIIFLLVQVVPLVLLTIMAWQQVSVLGDILRDIAVEDSSDALNASAVENIERMSTDTAHEVADFLYGRDTDILYLASLEPSEENYRSFGAARQGRVVDSGSWVLAEDGQSWVNTAPPAPEHVGGKSTNKENDDMDGFHYRQPDDFSYKNIPLYDEITFIGLDGTETVKYVAPDSPKKNHPFSTEKRDVSKRENTYIKAETYFEKLKDLAPGEIYVSDVIGAYTPSNFIGMYTPDIVATAAEERGYDIPYLPEAQAYAGAENPNGTRFEGIVRWATPVTGENGEVTGYVSFALNHDHIMEFTDHLTPMNERYTQLPSAYEGNYAFIWDYQCRNICHPRHHSIVGYDAATGEPQIPWLESSIYEGWQQSGLEKWTDYTAGITDFDNQSREKKPAAALTQAGLVGLDGRYLNNAPQCTGWMDLTREGGSGSFYILWSGIYKLNTAAAIPYYTGQYAPSEENGFSRRGFGFVAIGSGLEDFTGPAKETEERLNLAIGDSQQGTFRTLAGTTLLLIVLVVLIAVLLASTITGNITRLIKGISRFSGGERQFRFNAPVKDEFGTLADSFDDMADSLVDSVNNPLSITDMDKNIIYMNEQGLDFCQTTLDKVVGTPYGETSVYPQGSEYDPIFALEAGREAEVFYLAEQDRYLKATANYLLDKADNRIGYIIETNDMTEWVRGQIKLEEAMNEANRANEHKGEFLARMSHEIRTPMNAIIGVTNIAQRKLEAAPDNQLDTAELETNLNQIEASSQHLLGLLNDILDISKIEAGKIELSEETVEMAKLADTVAGIIRPRCEDKNIEFVTHFDSFSPVAFRTDPLRLRQVLINLLGNAVKFTPECGRIEFTMKDLGQEDGRTHIGFSVKDNGIGISPEYQQSIFESFEQGGRQVAGQYGGTGLGLAISKRIVQLFGGELGLESTPGVGSDFHFSIWLKQTRAELPDEVAIADTTGRLAGYRLLVVDDVEINRVIVVSMLEETGIAIDEASDGQFALDAFKNSPPGYYNIILMDVQMPNMDGYAAAEAIRQLDRPDAKTVPIVALTANAFKEDIDKALSFGMNGHVAKPVEADTLLEALFRHLDLREE